MSRAKPKLPTEVVLRPRPEATIRDIARACFLLGIEPHIRLTPIRKGRRKVGK